MSLSRPQVDRLGRRLAERGLEGVSADDRAMLLEFRRSYDPAVREVVTRVGETLGVEPSSRPGKTPESIVAKLRRGGTKLAQMQDIGGCRLRVGTRQEQDEAAARLMALFERHRVVDRRRRPSHGYRAVHVIVRVRGLPIEIQVRTYLQDQWANWVETMIGRFGADFKHGDAPGDESFTLAAVKRASDHVDLVESFHYAVKELPLKYPRPKRLEVFQSGMFHAIRMLTLLTMEATPCDSPCTSCSSSIRAVARCWTS
jgi:putative GTP pyrophosphokinase